MNAMYHAMQKAGLVDDEAQARIHRQEVIRREKHRQKQQRRAEHLEVKAERERVAAEKGKLLRKLKRLLGNDWKQLQRHYRSQPNDYLAEQVRVLEVRPAGGAA